MFQKFKEKDMTPQSPWYGITLEAARLWRRGRQRLHIDRGELDRVQAPFVLLVNHTSFYDFFYVTELLKDYRPVYVINDHILTGIIGWLAKRTAMIPKKLFYSDTAAVKIVRALRDGIVVVIFPEGRLSVDGTNYPVLEKAGALYKMAKVDVVIARITGSYIAAPKWRSAFRKTDVYISVKRVIPREEVAALSKKELNDIIDRELTYNEWEEGTSRIKGGGRAVGLERVLYRCADCGALYTTRSRDNCFYCSACGRGHELDDSLRFTDDARDIASYYGRIKEYERQAIEAAEEDTVLLRAIVRTKVFASGSGRAKRRERGVCTLTKKAFTYNSDNIDFSIDTERLLALAFSCGSEFELYYEDELYYFYPEKNRNQVARWALMVDLLKQMQPGVDGNDK